jgi:hypothetical protein
LRFRLGRRFGRRRFRFRLRLGFRFRLGFGFRLGFRFRLGFGFGFWFRFGLRSGFRFLGRGRRRGYFALGGPPVFDNFNGNGGGTFAHAQALGGGLGKIDDAAFRSGNPGCYGNNNLLAVLLVCYPELGAQGKTRMSGRKARSG